MGDDRLVMTSRELGRHPDPILEVVTSWAYEQMGRQLATMDPIPPQEPLYMNVEVNGVKSRYVFTGEIGTEMLVGESTRFETVWHRLPVES